MQKNKCVLVTRFSALGDVAMVIPVLYDVCRSNPEVTFLFASRPSMLSMAVNAPSNLKLVEVDLRGRHKGIRGMWRLFSELRKQYSIDAYADLHSVLRTHALRTFCRLCGIRTAVIDKGRSQKKALVRSGYHNAAPLTHSTERYRKVFESLGLPATTRFTSVWDTAKGDYSAFSHITEPKREGERWIGIAPFAAHNGKIYPLPLMRRVVEKLYSKPNVKIFLFGSGDRERDVIAEWCQSMPRLVSMAEKRHGFAVELALLSHLDAMVSMDSANMHLASLVATPVVSIWGATHPYGGFMGWRQDVLGRAVQLDMDCRPCSVFGNKPCASGTYACLHDISPDTVVSEVMRMAHITDNESSKQP